MSTIGAVSRFSYSVMDFTVLIEQRLIEKIRQLPLEKVVEVEDFVDFLAQRDRERTLTIAAVKLSEPVFQKIWDNSADAHYDHLQVWRGCLSS